jgi:hypothetical protein
MWRSMDLYVMTQDGTYGDVVSKCGRSVSLDIQDIAGSVFAITEAFGGE